jgi:hypothetical protein
MDPDPVIGRPIAIRATLVARPHASAAGGGRRQIVGATALRPPPAVVVMAVALGFVV